MCIWKPFPNNKGEVHPRKVDDCMKETCYYSEAYNPNALGAKGALNPPEKKRIRGKPIRN